MHRVLHVVQESVDNPRHRFLGSVKDTLGRREYFESRGMPVDGLVAEGRSDDKVTARLGELDLRPYGTVVFELPIYPKALRFLQQKAPHIRRWTRPINAELLHQVHLLRAHRLHPYAHDYKYQLWHDVKTGRERFMLDYICARRSDAVLSISDWETEHYWRWIAGRRRCTTVPYFLPSALVAQVPQNVEKENLCVCLLSTAKSVRPFPLDGLQNFSRLVRAYQTGWTKDKSWKFAMTGSTRVNTPWSHAIESTLQIRAEIEALGFVDDPTALLARARALAVLSNLGFGVKTKILDAIAARCWVLTTPGLYARLPVELQPYCLVVHRTDHVKGFAEALELATRPFPAGNPNAALRDRAFAALDALGTTA